MTKAIVHINPNNVTVRQRFDITKLEEFYTVELFTVQNIPYIWKKNNPELPWSNGHTALVQTMGYEERFTIIMEK